MPVNSMPDRPSEPPGTLNNGAVVDEMAELDITRYVEVNIDGVTVKLAVCK